VTYYPLTQLGVRLADDETVGSLVITTSGAGVVVGDDTAGRSLVLQMFGPEPADYAVVGGLALRQLLAFRALAVGAQVLIHTKRPDIWGPFVRTAAGTGGLVQCVTALTEVPVGRPNRPVLLLVDSATSLGGSARVAGPWSAVVSASDQVNQWNIDDLARVDLMFAETLSSAAARTVAKALSIAEPGMLVGLAPGEYSLISRAHVATVRLMATDIERWLTGQASS